jgi:hypothetical protein
LIFFNEFKSNFFLFTLEDELKNKFNILIVLSIFQLGLIYF